MNARLGMAALLVTTALPLGLVPLHEARAQGVAMPARPAGSCDIYAAHGTPCVAAHSSTRALYAAYNGPLYQVIRLSDGATQDIGVVTSAADGGGYADAAAQDRFCAGTTCFISILYDQSGHGNNLIQPPRGGFSGPALGGFNNLPIADMAPVTVMGHKVYGVYIAPGMGLRQNDARGTAVDDQAEGQYWVINGHHFNSGCCFDYGNAETDSRDDGNGTMETTFFGNTLPWYHGNPPGPWVMTDQENNLVGCVNDDQSKLCKDLPTITWRFVTAMAKGRPGHWSSLGGDARRGPLQVMYDGKRIDSTYAPMRKQGAILLGNGGDNSHGSAGTFYEGAMTAAGTYPSHETDQLVQANVVAARYDVATLAVDPAAAGALSPGLQTFAPGQAGDTLVTFTNTTGHPLSGVTLDLALPDGQWRAASGLSRRLAGTIAPDASVSATFHITAGPRPFNGDMVAHASWSDAQGVSQSASASQKLRNVAPVKINEFRVSDGSANTTNSFVELYNAGSAPLDLSGWTLTMHGTMEPIFSTVTVPPATHLAAKGFYLLGLANSGLAVPAPSGATSLALRDVSGIRAGDTVEIGTGASREMRKVTATGTAAGAPATLWQPLPDGPVITIPAGSTNIPVESTAGFAVGQRIALGYGTTYPVIGRDTERYEIATVAAVGKGGTQAYLGADAAVGATSIRVTSVENISPGDQIRLDIASQGHGIETVTVKSVGTAAHVAPLMGDVAAGATVLTLRGRRAHGFAVGDSLLVGTPANREAARIAAISAEGPGLTITLAAPLLRGHGREEDVVSPGTGLELTAPLRFAHAANMPFSARGTGLTLTAPTRFAHASNEPVMPLGTGVTLDRPLVMAHPIDDVVRDAAVTTAGYQGAPAPQQWFGGPALVQRAGNMVLRDASGLVVDSLNYGEIVDAWSAEGYHSTSGAEKDGCYAAAPGVMRLGWPPITTVSSNVSTGRFPDGFDTDNNCTDMMAAAASPLPAGARAGSSTLKLATVEAFSAGQSVIVGSGAMRETAQVTSVGTPGATLLRSAVAVGATVLPVDTVRGFTAGEAITVDAEAAQISSVNGGPNGGTIRLVQPLAMAHGAGVTVSGSGLTLARVLTKNHAAGEPVISDMPTPGAPNRYSRSRPTF
ncbi:MAG: lamin tail domain-containing protein [Sphingomonadales bacterium]|nr:lamin tail domain-containing protein [Sphingomonadales bacterium]MDE2171051.1 lamin tail domain-containing protein [Sphingomonadales bacterium]